MKTPESLEALLDHGIVQEVVRPLMSGKEAQIYLVVAGGDECVAKVYKEASQRTFKHRVEYTEGRRTLNSRDQRAMGKRTRYGRKQDEAAWRSAEVDRIFRLRDAGVRVPEPINFVDGVLVMELIRDAEGNPAPRLGDLGFGASEAYEIYQELIQEVVRMLCAGVIHGDLSEFNVLMGVDGPVLIDFPQSVDPAHNPSARKLLLRDVGNLHRFLERFAPRQPRYAYAQEMWSLYEANRLDPDTELRGDYRAPEGKANTEEVLALIDEANSDEQARRKARGMQTPVSAPKAPSEIPRSRAAEKPASAKPSAGEGGAARKKRRHRRQRKRSSAAGAKTTARASRGEATTAGKTGSASGQSDARRGSGAAAAAGAAHRPSRRRRRRSRPRRPGGSEVR